MIVVNASPLLRIGDTLAATPYLIALAEQHGFGAFFVNDTFCPAVRPLLPPDLGFVFGKRESPCIAPAFSLDLGRAFNYPGNQGHAYHMSQVWFNEGGLPVPPTPMAIPMTAEPIPAHPEVVLCAPFSNSDDNHSKMWFVARWQEVFGALLTAGLGVERIVVACSSKDDVEPFLGPQVTSMPDEPLPVVLGALRSCRLAITVDSGLSHLAHFGGVRHHLLLCHNNLPAHFVCNPYGRLIQSAMRELSTEAVIEAALDMLRG